MKYRHALLVLLAVAVLAASGCSKPILEEPDTASQVASRGKFAKAYGLFVESTFSENYMMMIEAIRTFKESLVFDPAFSRTNAYLAYCLLELCRNPSLQGEKILDLTISLEEARKYAAIAVRSNKTSAEAHAILAMAMLRLGELEPAKQELSEAASCNKNNRDYLIARGDYLIASNIDTEKMAKAYSKAAECYYRAITAEPDFGIPYLRILDIYETVEDAESIGSMVLEVGRVGMNLSDTRRLRLQSKGLLK